jgi:hypothetical protein
MISRLLVVAFASCLVCLIFSCSRQVTDPPQAVVVSACADTIAGNHRLAAEFGLQFDAPEDRFRVKKGQRDMPPGLAYAVTPNGYTDAKLVISGDDGDFRELELAYPTFSKQVGERTMRDAKGRNFGSDRWGYLQSGERWRYVKFATGDRVGYEPLPPRQADLLDQIVSSACFSRDENLKMPVSRDAAVSIAREDAHEVIGNLSEYEISATEGNHTWRVDFILKNKSLNGGAAHYEIDKITGKILRKEYEQ